MNHAAFKVFVVISSLTWSCALASADLLPIGYISYDVTATGSTAQFDIINQTGVNSSTFPDMTWPVVTPVSLSALSLQVDFSDGSTTAFGPSYFSLSPDGFSFNGGVIPIGGANPQPIDATLTGAFSPTSLTLNDGSTDTIGGSFSASIPPSSPPNLSDGDLAVIYATTTNTGPPPVTSTPEPGSILLLGTIVAIVVLCRRGLV
jgi:hypothetical protein